MNTDKAWERLGKDEPYFGVLSAPRFAGSQMGAKERAEFFRTGEEHIETVLAAIRARDPDFKPRRALDFGCGVGRLAVPLARVVEQVVGVDVSPSMLAEARRNCPGVEFSQEIPAGTFDLLHSFIVFQHIPVRRGLAITEEIVEKLEAGGWGALHFVYAIEMPAWLRFVIWIRAHIPISHALANLLTGRPLRRPLMQMNPYPLDRILALLQARGCHEVSLRFSRHGHFLGVMLIFKRTELPIL